MAFTERIKRFINENGDQLVPYFILVAMILIIVISMPYANLFSLDWLGIKCDQTLSLILAATGQSLVILVRGLDLSVGGMISLSNCLSAKYMEHFLGVGPAGIIVLVVLLACMGFVCGSINGFFITRFRIQPFIATLATWSVYKGLAILVLSTDGGYPPNSFINFALGRPLGIPMSLVFILILLAWWSYFRNTHFGMGIYAVGSNERSAYYNGINVDKVKILVFAMSGMFAALAGVFRTAQVASGSPTAGNEFILITFCAAVLGGINIAGGRGGILGTVIGAFIMKMLQDVLQFIGLSTYWTALFQGVLLISAVTITNLNIIISRKRRMEVRT